MIFSSFQFEVTRRSPWGEGVLRLLLDLPGPGGAAQEVHLHGPDPADRQPAAGTISQPPATTTTAGS